MTTFVAILLALGLIATLGTLLFGLVTMGRGGEFNQKHGNTIMRLRVYAQGFTLAMFVLLVVMKTGGY